MKIAITGVSGRVGGALHRHFEKCGHHVIDLNRSRLDFSSPHIEGHLDPQWDVLCNPAAISSPDLCEKDPRLASMVNTHVPALLATWCALHSVKFVHFSTDYVFSGDRLGKRSTSEEAQPKSVYGITKHAGEVAIRTANPHAIIARVSWIYGTPVKPGFVDQVVTRLLQGESIVAICDKFSIPTHIDLLAQWLDKLLATSARGVIHACPGGAAVSWHSIACEIAAVIQQAYPSFPLPPITAQFLAEQSAFQAARPVHTAMDNRSLEKWIGPVPDWKSTLHTYAKDRAASALTQSQA